MLKSEALGRSSEMAVKHGRGGVRRSSAVGFSLPYEVRHLFMFLVEDNP